MNEIATSGPTFDPFTFDPFNRSRAIVLSVFALALAVLSFHGALDNYAFSKIDELTKQNLVMLGIAVAFDAVVSVLQTFEFSPVILSIDLGQALDPINDGVERLTGALLLATGSLIMQDLLLTITSGAVFKWVFLAIAATMATCALLAQSNRVRIAFAASFGVSNVAIARFQDVLIKMFIVATVVRFIVPAFAAASLLVSQALVAPEIRQQQEALEQHEKSLSEVGAQISQAGDEAIEEQESQSESIHDETESSPPGGEAEPTSSSSAQPAIPPAEDLQALRQQRDQLERTLASLESEKQRLSNGISERRNSDWKDWIGKFGDDPDEVLAQVNAQVEQTESEIARKESEATCIGRPTTGGDCESYVAEREKQVLGEFKEQLESERKALRERLQSLQDVRKNAEAATGDEGTEGGTGWRDRVAGVVGAAGNLLPGSSDEEVQPTLEEIDREVAETSALEKQRASELACVDRRIAGERCDSPAVDDHVQGALDRVGEGLASDLQRLRTELASRQGEQARLVELAALRAERGQIESEIEEQEKLIERNESEMECAERRVAGKDCVGLIERATDKAGDYMARTAGAVEKLSDVGEAAGRMVSSVTERAKALSRMTGDVLDKLKSIDVMDIVRRLTLLLVLVAIENIVLPILFLAIALKASVPIARGLIGVTTSIRHDTREILLAMDQALPSRQALPTRKTHPASTD